MDVAARLSCCSMGIYDRPNQFVVLIGPFAAGCDDQAADRAGQPPSLLPRILPDPPRSWIQLSRDAQKMLQSQLMHEVQVNLQHIEQVLDAFFRDNSKRDELPGQPIISARSLVR